LWKSSCRNENKSRASADEHETRGTKTSSSLTYLRQDTRPEERDHRNDSNHSHISHPALKLLLDAPQSDREQGDPEHEPVGPSELVSVRFDGRDDEFVIPAVAEVEEGPDLRSERKEKRVVS